MSTNEEKVPAIVVVFNEYGSGDLSRPVSTRHVYKEVRGDSFTKACADKTLVMIPKDMVGQPVPVTKRFTSAKEPALRNFAQEGISFQKHLDSKIENYFKNNPLNVRTPIQ
ncbi:MAG: hypothetical protein KDJ35_08620 [Alphaproteobacteria bacterium]|nr:hypothetical protein [Alphaproteobacteria bacterium]